MFLSEKLSLTFPILGWRLGAYQVVESLASTTHTGLFLWKLYTRRGTMPPAQVCFMADGESSKQLSSTLGARLRVRIPSAATRVEV